VGTRTDAALAQVVAARAELADDLEQLEAAGRAAVDVPAKIRRAPGKAAGVAAGAAFVVLGGPKRVLRRARRAMTGQEEELPSELLPKEVEKALKKMGTDGRKVRGTLEREFARYLDTRAKERKKEGLVAAGTALAAGFLRPVAMRAGKQLAERALDPDGPSFEEQLQKVRARRSGASAAAETSATDKAGPRGPAGI
jgi:hypothetical protein